MTDIKNSKTILKNGNYTCVLCLKDKIFTSNKHGISPLIDFIDENRDFSGFSVSDKIVGKAAAMLFVKMGVAEVFAEVMSKKAVEILIKNNIACSWDTLCEYIVNRSGTGPCPIETAVKNVDDNDFDSAYKCILQKIQELRFGMNSQQ